MKKFYIRAMMALILTFALIGGSFVTLPEIAFAAGSSDIEVGDFVDIGKTDAEGYTGTPRWRIISKGEDGYMLFMSEYLWKGNGTNDSIGISFFDHGEYYKPDGQRDFRGTNAETWCNGFEEAILKDVTGMTIKPQNGINDGEFLYEQTSYSSGNKKLKFRKADAILYNNNVFFLSAQEAVELLGSDPARRVAYMPDGSTASQWYLRSTEVSTGNNCAALVKEDGELASVNADQSKAARPVFWAKFDQNTKLAAETDESGAKIWTISDASDDPQTEPDPQADPGSQTDPDPATEPDPQAVPETQGSSGEKTVTGTDTDKKGDSGKKAADASKSKTAKKVRTVKVNTATVSAAAINKAIRKSGGTKKTVTKIVLGSKVKRIKGQAFRKYKKLTVLEVRSKKLTKKAVRKSLRSSKIKTVKVKVSKKAAVNRKYVKKYKKIFTKKNSGRKVTVKR